MNKPSPAHDNMHTKSHTKSM